MATGPKTLSQLPIASSIAGSDRILVLSNPATVPNTVTVTTNTFAASIASQMPVANTLTAGIVIIGNTLTVNTVGGIQVNTNLLLTNLVVNTITTTTGSSANLTIDPDGTGDVVFTSATQVFVQSTAGATSTTAGDLVVTGGIAVGNNIIVGNTVTSNIFTSTSYILANAGFQSTNTYAGSYTDGLVMDYINTNGRISVGQADSITFYGNGIANIQLLTINSSGSVIANAAFVVGTVGSTANSFLANATTIAIGNSTVNASMNTSHFFSGNSTVYGLGNNTAEGVFNTVTNTSVVMTASTLAVGNTTTNVTINTSSIVISSNTLNLGTATAAANGATFLPNGLKLNWGWVSANSTTAGAITFTSAYTTNAYVVTATSNSAVATYGAAVVSWTKTGANVVTANATSTNVFWTAIGT